MLIRIGYDISFDVWGSVPIVALLSVHPSRPACLKAPDRIVVDPAVWTEEYQDSFGNICTRIMAPPGVLRLTNATVVEDTGLTDPVSWGAREVPVAELPTETLRFLMGSRFCEVD